MDELEERSQAFLCDRRAMLLHPRSWRRMQILLVFRSAGVRGNGRIGQQAVFGSSAIASWPIKLDAATDCPTVRLRAVPSVRAIIMVGVSHANDHFRICFRWTGSDAEDVEIVDYH
jgi:hypothetical protein